MTAGSVEVNLDERFHVTDAQPDEDGAGGQGDS